MNQRNNSPIRIAHIIGKMWAGGVETVVFNYYRAIDHNKFQLDFYYDADSTVEPPQDLIDMGAHFYKLSPYQKIWKYILELRKHLMENNYSIIHSHLNSISVFPLFAAWSVGVPVRIAHNHSVPGGPEWKRNLMKNFLKLFSRIFATDYFACSEKAGRWLFGNVAYNQGEVVIVKNAIDFTKFKINTKCKNKMLSLYGLNDSIVYGNIGRFTFAKNHAKLLRIFKHIKARQENSKLLLVGDGELHDEIYKMISKLELDDHVICVGKVSNPGIYYCMCDVVILPSLYEGFSMTALESQISGTPILISESIPREAVISNGCVYARVDEVDEIWAEKAMNMVGMHVELNDRADEYRVEKCTGQLQDWYTNKLIANRIDEE